MITKDFNSTNVLAPCLEEDKHFHCGQLGRKWIKYKSIENINKVQLKWSDMVKHKGQMTDTVSNTNGSVW